MRWAVYASTAALLWSTIGIVYKLSLSAGAHASWLILGRPALGGLASLSVIAITRHRPGKWSFIIGFFSLGPLFVLYLKAIEYIGAGLAAILLYTAPIWVVLLGPLLSEPVKLLGYLAALLGFLGIVLISLPSVSVGQYIGLLYGLGSGLSYAAYMLLAKLASRRGASVAETGLHSLLYASIMVAIVVHPVTKPNSSDIIGILYLGLFTMIIPYLLHVRALAITDAYKVAIMSLLEPVGAILLAHIILHENLALVQIIGSIIVLLSAALVLLEQEAPRDNHIQ